MAKIMILELLSVVAFTFSCLIFLSKAAVKVQLVDKPNHRKLHNGAVPLVGGIALCATLAFYITFIQSVTDNTLLQHNGVFVSSIIILTLIGAMDDKFDLSYKLRFAIQALICLAMIHLADIKLMILGDMFGFGSVNLGWLSTPITLLAVIGAINAFNMVDGIDGLLGGLSIITFSSLAILLFLDGQVQLAYLSTIIIAALTPYLLMNLGIFGQKRKVFMGDAGSMMIGFTVIWLILQVSQSSTHAAIRPVTALWLIAIPLTDMAAIMYRRIREGDSPFKPDREHLHHIFQRIGLSSRQSLAVICCIAAGYAAFGIYGEVTVIKESTMFYLFIANYLAYTFALRRIWRITAFLRKQPVEGTGLELGLESRD